MPHPIDPVPAGHRRQLAAAIDLALFEQLVVLGWKMPVRRFAATLAIAAAAGLPLLTASALYAMRLVRSALIDSGLVDRDDLAGLLPVAVVAFTGYVTLGLMARELFTRRRDIVARPSNLAWYRAVDLESWAVWVAFTWVRVTVVFMAVTVCVAAMIGVLSVSPSAWTLLTVPLAGWWAVSATSAFVAGRPVRRSGINWIGIVTGAGLAAAAGWSLGAAWRATSDATLAPSLSVVAPSPMAVTAVATVALLGFGAMTYTALRRLGRTSFTDTPSTPAEVGSASRSTEPRLVSILHREVLAGRPRTLLTKLYSVMALVVAVSVGVAVGAGSQALPSGLATVVTRLAAVAGFVAGLAVAESVLAHVGPGAIRRHLRVAWELGASEIRLPVSAIGYYTAHGALLGLALFATVAPITGPGAALGVLVIPLAVFAAAALGEALATTPKHAVDGSTRSSLFTGMVAVALSLPVLVVVALGHDTWFVLAIPYLMLLTGGAVACVSQRMLAMPYESTA